MDSSCPDPSRLDEWFLGGGRAGSQRLPLVPFFPEVHEELTRSWKATFIARNKSRGSSPLEPVIQVVEDSDALEPQRG